ncbi:MAG: sulfatase-like hydrolase/transferase, partial [Pirellulales bacterium]|nr:sulfatase-like hydrolase/transferase [Pirellulales bacterium]
MIQFLTTTQADQPAVGARRQSFPRRVLHRITTLAIAAVAVLVAQTIDPQQVFANQPERPNILLIMVDDLGYGDLSSYGAKDLKSPAIDSLVADGVRMDNFYANCPVCSPTRAALLTGRFQDLVGVPGVIRSYDRGSWGYLDPKAPLITDVIKKVGYKTALV